MGFEIKDSGARQEFSGGMVRDTTKGKTNFLNVLFGPMLYRWAEHMTKGRTKYPDPEPGVPNWTLAEGKEELLRARESALRHMLQWLNGHRDEDHAAAVYFNINLAEYVLDKMADAEQPDVHDDPSWGPESAARFGHGPRCPLDGAYASSCAGCQEGDHDPEHLLRWVDE